MSSVQAFISVLEEFLNELKETFPEEKKIEVYFNSFKAMKKVNPRAILDGFMAEAAKHSDLITARNESYFLDSDDEFLKEINVKRWWTPDLSPATKDAIWSYLNTLFVLGTTISSIPPNLLTTIEGVAEQCASQMEGADGSMNPDTMGSLLSGMQSMIGNLMSQNPTQQQQQPSARKPKKPKSIE